MDFIQGEKFEKIGDFTYSPLVKSAGDYCRLPNTLRLTNLKDVNIVYTHTLYVKQLFNLIDNAHHKFIIVTHNCDYNVDASYNIPDNVVKWFAQNVAVENARITSIPIGLENDRWFPEIDKKSKMIRKLEKKKEFKNMVYMNHNVSTNPAQRKKPYEVLGGKPWVTSMMGSNGQGFDNYLDNIYNHPFVVCPEGNGIDTHRTWECLYMNTIPIEKRNINNQFYADLPILFINEWEEITEEFLHDEYMRMFEMKWNMNKLKFEYWKNLIQRNC